MKPTRIILIALAIAVLAVAPMLVVDYYKAHKSQQEFERMTAVKLVVQQKVDAYKEATGHYPDSIAVLSFTNTAEEIGMLPDLQKIRYRLTPSGYAVGWDGAYGYAR
jgi:hypothetical protein